MLEALYKIYNSDEATEEIFSIVLMTNVDLVIAEIFILESIMYALPHRFTSLYQI